MAGSEILCVGELLWDSLPAGLFLGGAPFNVACHLRAAGLPVSMVSRVGSDQLGGEALRRAARFGVATELVQVDPRLPTGLVRVTIRDDGNAEYEIVEPAAWDAIDVTPALLEHAAGARAIVFGTLAQRGPTSRRTIERLWQTDAMRVLDVNLRPPHDDPTIVHRSLGHADVVKMNEGEMRRIAEWFDLPPDLRDAAAALSETYACRTVCITRGREGAALWRDGRWTEHHGFQVEVRDTVGAGDAFLAVLLAGLLSGTEDRALLQHANLIGAYVTTQVGAVPADQPSPPAPEVFRSSPAPDRSPAGGKPRSQKRRRRGT